MMHMCRPIWHCLIRNTITPKGFWFRTFYDKIIEILLLLAYMFLSSVSNYEYSNMSYDAILKLLCLLWDVRQTGDSEDAKLHSLLV